MRDSRDLCGKYLVMRESPFQLNTCHVLERQMLFGSRRLHKMPVLYSTDSVLDLIVYLSGEL